MIQVVLDADALARTRFVVSPLHELVATLFAWPHQPRPQARPMLVRARAALRGPGLPLLTTLAGTGTGYIPDFLSPHPDSPAPSVAEQLDQVAATPAERVEAELEALTRGRPLAGLAPSDSPGAVAELLAAGGRRLAVQAAEELRRYWQLVVAPEWDAARAVLEADVAHRAQTLARQGAGQLIPSLHPSLGWDGRALSIESRYYVTLPAPMIVFVPSLVASAVGAAIDPVYELEPRAPVITYPAVPSAPSGPPASADLRRLLGVTRADLLATLTAPATTGTLAEQHYLTAPTVSYHLGILLRAGLVTRERAGREVRYRRTERGTRLTRTGS
ncbi:ArsR/SmtB family transcription factor [Streptacidiphilus jiangxiensis]|uniref:Helix-turn-helix domain-containing protein n=1 Tax=Streptacidiphilus jiangxiensis TaxID=235985 RepID=A0A1H7WPR2_STRJI|nr:helix-turn-helix domain-containing protein [Streptacidiphilus jiangxiensis]SEM23530.1 Helix-turn-helix domain-containing protein [Streptacidiphilus jiangxiensis]